MPEMKCYRVWMRDGYASLHNAESISEAKRLAIDHASRGVEPLAMSVAEKRLATTVRRVECISD